MIKIAKSVVESLGFDLSVEAQAYEKALQDHKFTVDVPAPIAHPLVMDVVRAGGFEVVDDTPQMTVQDEAPLKYAYSKAQMFMEMTDEEFEKFAQVEAQQSPRERAIFANATEIDEDHPLFPKLKVLMKITYGDKRAFDILAAGRFKKS